MLKVLPRGGRKMSTPGTLRALARVPLPALSSICLKLLRGDLGDSHQKRLPTSWAAFHLGEVVEQKAEGPRNLQLLQLCQRQFLP